MASRSGRIRLRQISKTFESGPEAVRAIDGVDLTFQPGTATSIVGPNGAGKSTLLGLIAGVVCPTAGHIERIGQCASLLQLGVGFHDELTARENLKVMLAISGVGGEKLGEAVVAASSIAGIGTAIDRPVKRLSTGMRARVGLAAALVAEPAILLMDEVLAVGDQSFQADTLERVDRLVTQGAVLLLVTHSLDLAAVATRRSIWMDGGRVVRDGPSSEVLSAYQQAVHGWRRTSGPAHARVTGIRVSPGRISPGSAVRVSSTIECRRPVQGLEVAVEVRAAVGSDSTWMRTADEPPEDRARNLVAWTRPTLIKSLDAGPHRLDFALDSVPITPTLLELSVVLRDVERTVIDERSVEIAIGSHPRRPQYWLRPLSDPHESGHRPREE